MTVDNLPHRPAGVQPEGFPQAGVEVRCDYFLVYLGLEVTADAR